MCVLSTNTSGLQRLAGVHDPPESCDIPIKAEFDGDYHGGSGETGNGQTLSKKFQETEKKIGPIKLGHLKNLLILSA